MANRVLIITGDDNDAKALQDVLGKAKDGSFTTEWVTQLSDGLKRLHAGGIDAIMADLSLPDSQGIETFDKLFATAPHTPIMTLSALDDEMLTTEAVQHGAQGYLSKGHLGSYAARHASRLAVPRPGQFQAHQRFARTCDR
jgi:DNA-binding response OmpR family regulator